MPWLQHDQIRQVNKMELRRFNNKGIEAFREALSVCRENPSKDIPNEMLTSDELTSVVTPRIHVQQIPFKTKRDAAVYFHNAFVNFPEQTLLDDSGLWTWLSLFFFEIVCPKQNGLRKVRNDYTYVYEAGSMRHFYRHLLFVSWRIQDIAPSRNRLLLDSSIASLRAGLLPGEVILAAELESCSGRRITCLESSALVR
jgi:hypothetical protein